MPQLRKAPASSLHPYSSCVSFHSLQSSAKDDGRTVEMGNSVQRVPAMYQQEVDLSNGLHSLLLVLETCKLILTRPPRETVACFGVRWCSYSQV